MGMAPQPPLPEQPLEQQGQATTPPQQDDLPEELQIALWQLLEQLETDDEIPRRFEIRDILKRRLIFRGEQYWWYDNKTFQWMPPNVAPVGQNLDDFEEPPFRHVTNLYQATALSLCSVLSQNNTQSTFFPEKASDPKDVKMAKSSSKVVELVHRNNNYQDQIDQLTYYMCNDGFIGNYVRFVSDAEKFGTDQRDILAAMEVPIGPATTQCQSCGNAQEGTTETNPTCPECGEANADVPAPTTTVPQHVGTISLPKGQEVVSMVPALQLKRTMWADEQSDFLYLDWITDLHKSIAIATYPEKEDKLQGDGGESQGGSANSYERIARRLLYLGTGRHTGMILKDLGTFRRAWIRPKAFYSLQGHSADEATPCKRCQLLQRFPDGARVVFFNSVYCESSNESMDKKWTTMHTLPGEGQIRETLMSAIVPIQEQLNDACNLLFEIMMFGVPEGFAADKLMDMEARSQQTASAGNITPVNLDALGAGSIGDKLMFTPAVAPSVAMMRYIEMLLNEIPQLLSGNSPALFGGDTGSNDTAAGISIQRNQALGRIGRAWRRMQVFLSKSDEKAVRCFAENRQEDVEVSNQSPSGDFSSDMIQLEDMQGNVLAYPEDDSQYPTLQSDIRGLMSNLYNSVAENPLTQSYAGIPANLEYMLRTMGATEIEIPGQQQRVKTYRDIDQLTAPGAQPTLVPAQPPSPQAPQGAPPQLIPSVQPDPDVDDLKVAADTAKTWLISDTGMEAQVANPAGYANVKAFLKACTQLEKQQELQQQIAAMAVQGEGPAADLGSAEKMQPPEGAPHPANLQMQQQQTEAKAKQPAPGRE